MCDASLLIQSQSFTSPRLKKIIIKKIGKCFHSLVTVAITGWGTLFFTCEWEGRFPKIMY